MQATEVVEHWANTMTQPPPEPLPCPVYTPNSDLFEVSLPISLKETHAALRGPSKALGLDGICLSSLRKLPLEVVCCILNILLISDIASAHETARLAFIPKINNATSPSDLRPLSISSYLQRTLNKILSRRLQNSIKLLPIQRAFLPYNGTFENLAVLDGILNDAKSAGRELRLASIDLRKAFDMVSHDSVLWSLRTRGYPEVFINYIERLYLSSKTLIEFGQECRTFRPTRGVRQGDPLSPLLFNLVLDDILSKLDKTNIGYQLTDDFRLMGLAFADDLILLASTKSTLQRLLNIADPLLKSRGLEINTNKSFTISHLFNRKEGKGFINTVPEFNVGDRQLPAKGMSDRWRYLGVDFDSNGRVDSTKDILLNLLNRLTIAPLKPHQRLIFLKDFLIPRLLYKLVSGPRPSYALLSDLDKEIRKVVKSKWLKLENSVPNAYLYTHTAHGGLDIPCLQTFIPRIRLSRLTALQHSTHLGVQWMLTTEHFKKDLAKTRLLCERLGTSIETATQETDYWSQQLHNTFDGAHFKKAHETPFVHYWIKGMPYLSGKEYLNLLKLRINALPTRARLARGRPGYNKRCRHGCHAPETLAHVAQMCDITHKQTIKRHDDVCDRVARLLRERGHEVVRERVFRRPGAPGLKPDLVITTPTEVWVLDAEVCGPNRDLAKARQDKIAKYDVEFLRAALPDPQKPRRFGSITISMSGVWDSESARTLLGLGVTKRNLMDLTVLTLQGTLRIYRSHRVHKSGGYHQARTRTADS